MSTRVEDKSPLTQKWQWWECNSQWWEECSSQWCQECGSEWCQECGSQWCQECGSQWWCSSKWWCNNKWWIWNCKWWRWNYKKETKMEKMRNILRILKNKGMRHLESHKNVLTTKQNYASTLDKKMVASMAINASKLMVKKSLDQ